MPKEKNWQPIARTNIEVQGVNGQYPGLLDVEISLSETPPDEWQHFFNNPVGVSLSLSMRPPQLGYNSIHISPSDGEIEKYVKHVDARIASANKRYETEVIPALRAREQRQQAEQSDEERRLKAAKDKLKWL